mgnify:CR=1 FL=1
MVGEDGGVTSLTRPITNAHDQMMKPSWAQLLLGGVILAAVAGGWGCLLSNPPDYNDPAHRPVLYNFEPAPPQLQIDIDGVMAPSTERFAVDVWHGDPDRELRFRWFLNYDPNNADTTRCGYIADYNATREEQRTDAETIGSFRSGQCNRVSVVVTDGQWLNGDQEGCAQVAEGANWTYHDWWILAYSSQTGDPSSVEMRTCSSIGDPILGEALTP